MSDVKDVFTVILVNAGHDAGASHAREPDPSSPSVYRESRFPDGVAVICRDGDGAVTGHPVSARSDNSPPFLPRQSPE